MLGAGCWMLDVWVLGFGIRDLTATAAATATATATAAAAAWMLSGVEALPLLLVLDLARSN